MDAITQTLERDETFEQMAARREMEHRKRLQDHTGEIEAFTFLKAWLSGKAIPPGPLPEGFQEVLAREFSMFNREKRTWGNATKEEHIQRIMRLRDMIAGIQRTIDFHQTAEWLLSVKGATSLNALLESSETGAVA